MAPDIKEAVHALSRKMAEEKDPAQLALLKQQLRRLFRRAMPIQRGRRPASDAGRLADDTGGNRQHKKHHTSGDRTILCIAASFSRPRLALALKAALSSSIAFRNSSELSGAVITRSERSRMFSSEVIRCMILLFPSTFVPIKLHLQSFLSVRCAEHRCGRHRKLTGTHRAHRDDRDGSNRFHYSKTMFWSVSGFDFVRRHLHGCPE